MRAPAGPVPVPEHGPRRAGPATVLGGHIVCMFLYYTLQANVFWLMPLLVRLRFGSTNPDYKDWQTTLITAAIPTFMMASIFWAELLRRFRLRTYLLLYWLTAALAYGCVGLAQNYTHLLICQIVGAAGLAGWVPLSGKLLKHFYSDAVRGRAFAALNIAGLVSSVLTIFVVGRWLEADPGAFRIYFPATAIGQAASLLLLGWLARITGAADELAAEPARGWSRLLKPVLHMGSVLKADRVFLRYEVAFMTYGAAYMICEALLPVLATDRLGMRYEDYAQSTHMAMRLAMLVAALPMGWLLDRLGPMRTSGLAFGVLVLYPVLLLTAHSPVAVGVASAVFGFGLGGVMMGWTLGPVALARTTADVPIYSGIHATLVGVRGVLFQGLGMLAYKLSGGFVLPLLLATALFATGAAQMWQLYRGTHRPQTPAPGVAPAD